MQTQQTPPELSIAVDYIERLSFLVDGAQGREGVSDPDSGSNAADDNMIDALQDTPGDLSRLEVAKEIEDLNERQQNELVALLWLGRGDYEAEEWQEAVAAAAERRDTSTARYLLGEPLTGSLWLEGLNRLGIGSAITSGDA